MAEIQFEFDQDRTIESIIYLAQHVRHATKMTICKLLYFADIKSLEVYGRFITGDKYVAMQYGPVPSRSLDLINATADSMDLGFELVGNIVTPKRQCDEDEFSESDIEILEEIVSAYKNFTSVHLSRLSHDSAYHVARDKNPYSNNPDMSIEDIVNMLETPDEIMAFLKRHSQE